MGALDAFIEEFAVKNPNGINDASIFCHERTVVTILIIVSRNNEIAIFIIIREIAVLCVFRLIVHQRNARYAKRKFVKLIEKRPAKIKFDAIIHCIPLIAPPFFFCINFKRRIRMKKGNHFFAGKIALSAI